MNSKIVGQMIRRQEIISSVSIERFRATLDHYLFSGDAVIVPLGFHWTVATEITPTDVLLPDGSAPGIFGPPPAEMPHRVWAGGKLDLYDELPLDALVDRVDRIESAETKYGQAGPICLVTVRSSYEVGNRVFIDEQRTIAFHSRDRPRSIATGAHSAQCAAPAPLVDWSFRAGPVLLFRYSALTNNSHRIHFDIEYARNSESLDGVVIQGPLQATVLLNACAKVWGFNPKRFEYRHLRILIEGPGIRITVTESDDRLVARLIDRYGNTATIATAWRQLSQCGH